MGQLDYKSRHFFGKVKAGDILQILDETEIKNPLFLYGSYGITNVQKYAGRKGIVVNIGGCIDWKSFYLEMDGKVPWTWPEWLLKSPIRQMEFEFG